MKEKSNQAPQTPIYQLKVTLRYSRPPIWRRIEVPSDISLIQLHQIIQIIMDWKNYHLWQFSAGTTMYGDPDHQEFIPDLDPPENARTTRLSDVLPSIKSKMIYEYDFGDDWLHEIVLEKTFSPEPKTCYPRCTQGKLAAPLEDCGGIGGYYELLECLENPKDPEYEFTREWLGDEFDPDLFDMEQVNKMLTRLAKTF